MMKMMGQTRILSPGERWIVENDTDDRMERVELMTEIFLYGMFLNIVDKQTIKGQYIGDPQSGDPIAFDCSECGAAMSIVNDPKAEQPNYCHGCGVKFDWEGVYEEIINKEME